MGIDVHQDFYVVIEQVGGTNPKPARRFHKQAFLHWAAKLKQSGAEMHAVYEGVRVWFHAAAATYCSRDSLLRGRSAEVG